jgi:hypothetical protein
MLIIIGAVLFLIFLIFIYFEGKQDEAKEAERIAERIKEISDKYASDRLAINKEFFDLEDKFREYERKERELQDLRTEAITRQKRRAAHRHKRK